MILEAGAIAFGTWLLPKLEDKAFEFVYSSISEIDQKGKFYKIVKKTSDQLRVKYPDILGGDIAYFFKKDELFGEIVKLLFIDSKIDTTVIESFLDKSTLPENFVTEFIENLRVNLLKDKDFNKILTSKEIYLTCLGISSDIFSIVESSSLTYEEVVKIRELLTIKFTDRFNIKTFLESYLPNAFNNLSQVTFIGLGVDSGIQKGKRKNVNQIFVEPAFTVLDSCLKDLPSNLFEKLAKTKSFRIEYEDILSIYKNLVILGNPGSGKSFLIRSIICSTISEQINDFSKIERVPFRIELRKYLAFKKTRDGNIISYLVSLLENEYGVSNISEESIQGVLSQRKTLVFFDGLDEIFNALDKIEVKNDIENFLRNNLMSNAIITSRIEGYEEAAFDTDNFIQLNINRFSDAQIDRYVKQWYTIEEKNETIRNNEISDLLEKKDQLDEELIRNPLLLSLIVILYRNNLKLPESKLEIYKSCTSTLVDKWDTTKELSVDLDPEILRRKEAILSDLAYWQYLELSSSDKIKITYERAKSEVAKSLLEKVKTVDEYTVDDTARKFLNYAEKRSIYFDNNFTHKTFLEYYTAFWIYSNIERKHREDERDRILDQYSGNPFWHIVLELLLNLIDKDQPDDEIMDKIISNQLRKPAASLSFLLSVLSSIQNVSLHTRESLFVASIRFFISSVEKTNSRGKSWSFKRVADFNKFARYYNSQSLRGLIDSAFRTVLSSNLAESRLTLCYILYLETILHSEAHREATVLISENEHFNSSVFLKLKNKEEHLYKYVAFILNNSDSTVTTNYWKDYIDIFGLSTFKMLTPSVFTKSYYSSMFSHRLHTMLSGNQLPELGNSIQQLIAAGIEMEDIIALIFDSPFIIQFHAQEHGEAVLSLLNSTTNEEIEVVLVAYFLIIKTEGLSFRKVDDHGSGKELLDGIQSVKIKRMIKSAKTTKGAIAGLSKRYGLDSKKMDKPIGGRNQITLAHDEFDDFEIDESF
ncbi:NACHT domain-containing protein [Dyadobacter endophyticus]|uniref:NACHT domain-containing protein n=1 Tax=Dyadobacter endophyticus TaxID=1749036 RepID=UPI003CF0BD8C